MRQLVVLAAILAAAPATAEPTREVSSRGVHAYKPDRPLALAVNGPVGWAKGFAFAGSAYARVAPHHAIRLNVAHYDYHGNAGADLVSVLVFGGDGSETRHAGTLFDVSAGWMYFPRRLWDGPNVELGLLHRAVDTRVGPGHSDETVVDRDGRTLAIRGHLGWSWLIMDRVFVAFGLGASKGYSFGSQTTRSSWDTPMTTTGRYGEWTTAFESYLRFGIAFGAN